MKKKIALSLGAAAAVAAIAAPLAVGHASVSLLQPQGSALAGKSGTWILRVPNERDSRSTFKVTLNVPTAIQSSVSVRQSSQWAMTVVKDATAGIFQVTWKAKTADDQIRPGQYGVFEFRFKNPATAQSLCFSVDQVYNGSAKGVASEIVSWSGAPGTATPASCVAIVAS